MQHITERAGGPWRGYALGKHPSAGWSVVAGYYSAKGDMVSLQNLAAALEISSSSPQHYGLLKRYATEQQAAGWLKPSAGTLQALEQLAQEPWTRGSAMANTWLQALGSDPAEEVILLPSE